jgi:prepilin-type N-terminal cleavage/methylation domain-containing protein
MRSTRSGFRGGNRRGVTIIEIMTVLALAAILTAMTFPRLEGVRRNAEMNSAKLQFQAYLTTARAAAIRKSTTARFIRSGNTITVTADSSGTQITVLQPFALDAAYHVTVSRPTTGTWHDTITFGPRGIGRSFTATEKFYINMDSTRWSPGHDSVCVTRLGLINQGCAL